MRSRRAWLGVLAGCACNGHGAALAQGFGEALALAALIVMGLVVVATIAYVLLWRRLIRSTRSAAAPGGDAAAAVRAWLWGLLVVLLHAGLVGLMSRWRYGDGPEAAALVLAAFMPLAVLALLAGLAARRGRWWPVAPTLVMIAYTASLALQNWRTRELDELPGRVVEVAYVVGHGCARLSTGQVACVGANWQGQRGDGSERGAEGPTLVRGIDDATAIRVADGLACALRAEHPPACWGGREALPVAGERGLPWPLPGAGEAVALAPAVDAITWLERDGRLGGWPRRPPAELTRARLLVGDDDFDGGWACVIDEAGALACWPEDEPRPREVLRFAGPPALALAVDADAEVACTADARGTVRCFDLERGEGPRRTVEVPGLEQLVAVDDDGTFCARAGRRVTCWRGAEPAKEPAGLESADSLIAGAGVLCGLTGAERRCVTPGERPAPAIVLIERDRQP